jgi:hypothetical protein
MLDWHNIASGDGSGVNAWQNDYSRFSHDTNEALHSDVFPAQSQTDTNITQADIAPRGDQKPPGAAK